MKINFNDQSLEVKDNIILSELLKHQLGSTQGIAVAINDRIIPKNDWSKKILNSQDKILVITATQGG